MADPYSAVPTAPLHDDDDENQSFINAYDDDLKPEPSAPFSYSSAPDPTIASSIIEAPEFAKLETDRLTQHDGNNYDIDDEDEGFGHSTYGQRMDYTSASYKDKFFLFLWIFHFLIMFIVLIYQYNLVLLHNLANTHNDLLMFRHYQKQFVFLRTFLFLVEEHNLTLQKCSFCLH